MKEANHTHLSNPTKALAVLPMENPASWVPPQGLTGLLHALWNPQHLVCDNTLGGLLSNEYSRASPS